jgi:hypothetical protein
MRGCFRSRKLSLRLLRLVLRVCPAELVTLILDDTLLPRCVKFWPAALHLLGPAIG